MHRERRDGVIKGGPNEESDSRGRQGSCMFQVRVNPKKTKEKERRRFSDISSKWVIEREQSTVERY